MARFDFLATNSFFTSWSGGGFSMGLSAKNNLPKALVIFYREFEKRATDVLQTNGCGLCHEMAMHSMPVRAGAQLTANDAILKYAQENKALANVAYKPWENRSPEFWVMSGYISVADYVMKTGVQFQNPIFQRLATAGRWSHLNTLMRSKGFVTPSDAPKARFVKDSAKLKDFIWWKSQYKKNPRTHNYYVKDKLSIVRMSNESSLNNYATIVINGWLKASKKLGNVLPSNVTFVRWTRGNQTLGWGDGKIKKVARGDVHMSIENKFANLNNIFYSSMQRNVFNKRMQIMDAETKKLFKDMVGFWNSIKV